MRVDRSSSPSQVYKEHGYLWHFTLEEQMDYGPSIVAKFAHHERRVLEDLGQRVRASHLRGVVFTT